MNPRRKYIFCLLDLCEAYARLILVGGAALSFLAHCLTQFIDVLAHVFHNVGALEGNYDRKMIE